MKTRHVSHLALCLTLGFFGCQRPTPTAGPPVACAQGPVASSPAPFVTPPVLPGTPDVATLVAKVKPSVVSITTVHELKVRRAMPEDPFGGFFGPFGGMGPRGGDQVLKQQALGSGFIIDTSGHVVTNAHVIENADAVRVRLADDREFDAKIKGRDTKLDIALLEIQDASDLPAAFLGSSEALREGEYVVAIGNPFGLGHTVTMGIVSAKSRSIGAGRYDDFIQTDASINPGNSGGPLFNLLGQVVGINTAINPQGKGIGFAIPVDELKDVLSQLLTTGKVARGRLGVFIQPIDTKLAKALGLDRPRGALVADVEPAGPAFRAGIQSGDVILAVDHSDVGTVQDLPRMVARHLPASHIDVKVMRKKAIQNFDVTLDTLKDDEGEDAKPSSDVEPPPATQSSNLGLRLEDAPGGGVAVRAIAPDGLAAASLQRGDVILEVNQTVVNKVAELERIVRATPANQPVLIKFRRSGKTGYAALSR